jgi:hypothetical protein
MADPRNPSNDRNDTGIMSRVKQSATKQLAAQKDRAADGVGSVTQALRQSTQHLRDEKHDTIARYVEQAADQIDSWCNRVREKDVTEVLDDIQGLARRQPAVFIGSAFAIGLLGARFLKSSTDNASNGRERQMSRSQYGGRTAISEAADAPSTTAGVSVSDANSVISRPEPSTAAPAPGGGAGASVRTRRTTGPKSTSTGAGTTGTGS